MYDRHMYFSYLIGSEDIVNPNTKLILGLVWTLILHYQIAAWAAEATEVSGKSEGPKKALLAFVNVS